VATARGLCTDENVNELPFYVMDFVDGHVVRDKATAEKVLGPDGCRRASESIVDTMAAIHAVDLKSVGLDDLGRHDGYIARQLKRWHGNIVEQRTRELPLVDSVFEELMSRIPVQASTTIVHGDYRLDNCMVDAKGNVIAVLDWEMRVHGRILCAPQKVSWIVLISLVVTPKLRVATFRNLITTLHLLTGNSHASLKVCMPAT
jgi:aminoglycoside phosphotransferase (APT) family kinase protein